jgi:hypothetical protein
MRHQQHGVEGQIVLQIDPFEMILEQFGSSPSFPERSSSIRQVLGVSGATM